VPEVRLEEQARRAAALAALLREHLPMVTPEAQQEAAAAVETAALIQAVAAV
jgi:hypothetical protein